MENLKQSLATSEYESLTSQCLYYPEMGLSIHNKVYKWYEKYQRASPFNCLDWNEFKDSAEYTYFKYIREKIERTYFIQGLFDMTRSSRYYSELSADWIQKLQLLYSPQIYPAHGMQMMISYIGQMSPSPAILAASTFQAGNELARIQTITENMQLVVSCFSTLTDKTKDLWQNSEMYQPLRKLLEEALICYDWGEAFVALNLCIKPLIDELFLSKISQEALINGDHLTSKVAYSKHQSSEWQQSWSLELTQVVLNQNPDFSHALRKWLADWHPRTLEALAPFFPYFEFSQASLDDLKSSHHQFISKLNLP